MAAEPLGHMRSRGECFNPIVLDAASIAYAPYSSRLLLTTDPFLLCDAVEKRVSVPASKLLVRVHHALLNAERVIVLGGKNVLPIASMMTVPPTVLDSPPSPLSYGTMDEGGVLVVPSDEAIWENVRDELFQRFPLVRFCRFDHCNVFQKKWRIVLHIGAASLSEPGARLADAWAGNVPVIQLVTDTQGAGREERDVYVSPDVSGLLALSFPELLLHLENLINNELMTSTLVQSAGQKGGGELYWKSLLEKIVWS